MKCKHCQLDEEKIIYKGSYWTLILSKQDYLGRAILALNRHIGNFSDINDNELMEFKIILHRYESILNKLYGCTMLNWCCNMNNAYGKDNCSPHVHLHIRPRYKEKVIVNDMEYTDKEFGAHYDRFAPIQFDEETIQIISQMIKEQFDKI